jgi:integrative and conjugative element protein (TIGR02256 family)
MIFNHPLIPAARILVEDAVTIALRQYRQTGAKIPESGGVLLGFRRVDHLHIVEATPPQSKDKRSRFSFDRLDSHHQKLAIRRWIESDETMDYLGEWHTHPQSQPTPSSVDIGAWRTICLEQLKPMIFLILGTSDSNWLGLGFGQCIFEATLNGGS